MTTASIHLTIDGKAVTVPPGTTVLQAAARLGIEIPTMCYREGTKAQTSCMLCLVKINGNPNLVPACSRPAEAGMVVENDVEEVNSVRRTALNLMLSDHIGDCVAPCTHVCPAHMEIPRMLRQVVAGENLKALITVKRDIAFPAILGRICPEICEGGCRRGTFDTVESICLVKRYVADEDLASEEPWIPKLKPATGKKVAIVGSGPTGMACAYYLLAEGHACTIYDASLEAGGALRYRVPEERLPRAVLDAELNNLTRMGCVFAMGVKVGVDVTVAALKGTHDAVFLAAGHVDEASIALLGLESKRGKLVVNRDTLETSVPGVFAGGGMLKDKDLSIWSLSAGKTAAISISQLLSGQPVVGRPERFNSKIGKMSKEEVARLLESQVNRADRHQPSALRGTRFSQQDAHGFSTPLAVGESSRCLHCDCRAKDACKLRDLSDLFKADQKKYAGKRRPIAILKEGQTVHLDAGKCIQCGLCVQIAQDGGEPIGLTYDRRGFETAIVAPLGYSLADALTTTAVDCARACPTGAISILTDGVDVEIAAGSPDDTRLYHVH